MNSCSLPMSVVDSRILSITIENVGSAIDPLDPRIRTQSSMCYCNSSASRGVSVTKLMSPLYRMRAAAMRQVFNVAIDNVLGDLLKLSMTYFSLVLVSVCMTRALLTVVFLVAVTGASSCVRNRLCFDHLGDASCRYRMDGPASFRPESCKWRGIECWGSQSGGR